MYLKVLRVIFVSLKVVCSGGEAIATFKLGFIWICSLFSPFFTDTGTKKIPLH